MPPEPITISQLPSLDTVQGTDRLVLDRIGAAVTAGSFVVGQAYQIINAGNTSFTTIGAESNTVGAYFVATGAGTGTGTAGPINTGDARVDAMPISTAQQQALDGKANTSDPRLSDAREWIAPTVDQATAEAGVSTTRAAYSPLRMFQGIAAWWAASAFKTKLDGIAAGATVNASDAQLRDRSTHTGTQALSTIAGLGAGVPTALAVNIGTPGAPVILGGAGGTPSALGLINATGLPLSTGVTGILPVVNGGTGTATPGLVAGTHVSISGAWPNQTITVTHGGGGGGGGGDALTTNPLSQFAATTSAQLRGVISDETGSGLLFFQGGDLGTPSAGVLTNCTGLPIGTGVTGLGTGIAAALAINAGSPGAPVLLNGAGGTPSSLTLINATGLPFGAGISGKPTTLAGYGITDAVGSGDARLSDARTPTAHTQAASTISDSTAAGQALLTATDAAAQRTSLGLGSLATQSGTFSGTSSGTNTGDQDLSGKANTGAIGSSGLTQAAGILGAASAGPPQVYAPLGLAISGANLATLSDLVIPLSDETTALTASSTVAKLTIPYWPRATVITDSWIWAVATAPTGASLQFDIQVNGTSIYLPASGGTYPTIAASSANSTSSAGAFTTAFAAAPTIAAGSSVSFFIRQIGSTVAGAGLKVIAQTRRAG